jgi:hypothetical protein
MRNPDKSDKFIDMNSYYFHLFLWTKAIPSQVRIKEIKEEIKPETIEVIVDPDKLRQMK